MQCTRRGNKVFSDFSTTQCLRPSLCGTMFFLTATILLPAAAAAQGLFITPLAGVPYEDWTIVNYTDRNPATGPAQDYLGGPYVYDGHSGIDITLPNFAAMDAGVPVYAAADGVVATVVDQFFDRCSADHPCPGDQVNGIAIDHGNGLSTHYLHLRLNSTTVTVGQQVFQGDVIGLVGSSGASSDAHLHFEVHQDETVVETYEDPETYWVDPLPYAGTVRGILDIGVTDHNPSSVEYRERPEEAKAVFLDIDEDPIAWVNLHTLPNDDLQFRWYRPNGSLYSSVTYDVNRIRYGWASTVLGSPGVSSANLGEWEVAARIGPPGSLQEYARQSFYMLVRGDINMDLAVDQEDIDAFIAGWAYEQAEGDIVSWQKGDLNLDGKTNLEDEYLMFEALLANNPALASGFAPEVPEPATGAMFFAAMLGLFRSRSFFRAGVTSHSDHSR